MMIRKPWCHMSTSSIARAFSTESCGASFLILRLVLWSRARLFLPIWIHHMLHFTTKPNEIIIFPLSQQVIRQNTGEIIFVTSGEGGFFCWFMVFFISVQFGLCSSRVVNFLGIPCILPVISIKCPPMDWITSSTVSHGCLRFAANKSSPKNDFQYDQQAI